MAVYDFKSEDESWKFLDRPLRNCTEKDWAKFHEPDEETKTRINTWSRQLNVTLKDTFKCLDSYENIALKPNKKSKLSFFIVPCDKLPWGPYEVG